jgi:hypothetical protein
MSKGLKIACIVGAALFFVLTIVYVVMLYGEINSFKIGPLTDDNRLGSHED